MKQRPKFYAPIHVRYAETDMQGHVFFGHYLTYFDVAATEYLKAIGYGLDEFLKDGVDFYYVESKCLYKDRAFFDEILHVYATIGYLGNRSFKFEFEIHEKESDRYISSGHIVAVTVDPKTHKSVPLPEKLRDAVNRYESA